MARPVHGLLRPLLLAVCCLLLLLLLQVSECSTRPSSSPADHVDELHHQLLLDEGEARTSRPPTSTEVAADGRTGADDDDAAPSSSAWAATPPPARAVMGAIASSSPPLQQASDRALLARAGMRPAVPLLLRSKLARRFLLGTGVDEAASATNVATGASCHSYNPHINCPSAWKP